MVKNFRLGLIFGSLILVAIAVFVMAAPIAPTGIYFIGNTTPDYDNNGNFTVNWTTGGGDETNYTIWVSIDGGTSFFTTADNDSDTGYVFSNVTDDANYTFKIQAVNDTLDDANSSLASIVVDTTSPAIEYTLVGINVNNSNVSQNWVSVNITASDIHNASAATISYSIYNSTTGLWNQTNFTDAYATTTINWTGLVDGVYTYNVTVNDSATNSNSTTTRTITLDTTNPAIEYTSVGIDVNNSNVSQNWISVNITASDTNNASLVFVLYNTTGEVNTTTYDNYNTQIINWTSLPEGVYTYNVTANDSATNTNSTTTRTITLDTTNPVALASCSPSSVNSGGSVTRTCSGTDGGSDINSSLTTANSTITTSTTGTFSYTCSVTDNAGNSHNNSASYTVTTDNVNSDGNTATTSTANFWTKGTHTVTNSQFSESFSRELYAKQRLKVQVGSSDHHVGVLELTATTATINVSSDPQQVVLGIGEEEKFEVSGDNYYDIFVRLNSISNNKANVTVQSINELIVPSEVEEDLVEQVTAEEGEANVDETADEGDGIGLLWWILGGIGVVIILGAGIIRFLFKKGKLFKNKV